MKLELALVAALIFVIILGFIAFNFWLFNLIKNKNLQVLLEKQKEYHTTLSSIGDAVIMTDRFGKIKYMNSVAEKLTDWAVDEAYEKNITNVFHIINEDSRIPVDDPVKLVLEEGVKIGLANHTVLISKSGKEIPIADSAAPVIDSENNIIGVVLIFRDQTTERMTERLLETKLRLHNFALTHSLDEILTNILDEAENLTRSKIGFYHFLLPDQKTLSLQAWSTRTMKEYCKAEGKGLHYDIDKAGIWVEAVRKKSAVIHNDYLSIKNKNGLPAGYAELIRELVVPILRNDKIVAILGVGNKEIDYDEKDIKLVEFLANEAWEIAEKRKAEEEINLALKRWTNTFDSISDPMAIISKEGDILQVNKAFIKYTNKKDEEIIGEKCYKLIHHTDVNICGCPLIKSIDSLKREEMLLDVGERIFNVIVDPILDSTGNFAGSVHIMEDITERKKYEKSLQESEEKFRHIFENSPIGKSLTGIDGSVYVNKAFCEMLGYSAKELRSKNWKEFTHPDDIEKSQKVVDRLLAGESQIEKFQKRYIHKDGTIVYSEIITSLQKDYEGKPKFFISNIIDITKDLELRKKLEESEQNYREIFNSSTEAIFIDDMNGKMIDVNEAMLKMYGYESKEEVLSGNIGDLSANLEPYSEKQAQEMIRKAIQDGINRFDWLAKRKDGSHFWVEMTLKKTTLVGKECILAIGHDITKRKEMETEINKQKDELISANNELKLFNELMVGRELRMLELKRQINELSEKLNLEKPFSFNEEFDSKN